MLRARVLRARVLPFEVQVDHNLVSAREMSVSVQRGRCSESRWRRATFITGRQTVSYQLAAGDAHP